VVSCGHPPPLLLRDGRVSEPGLDPSPPLGLGDAVRVGQQPVPGALAEAVLADLTRFAGGGVEDDVALLLLEPGAR
jgi:hypothetical protein